jgi:hemolysin activation/secretion protein
VVLALALLPWPAPALAQRVTPRMGEPPPLLQEQPAPAPAPVLPPVPPPELRPPEPGLVPTLRVFVREIRVVGSTVFKPEELDRVTAPYVNRELSTEDLQALGYQLTLLYVNRGYVNSGAILPDQSLTDGVVTYQIVEGGLTDIQIQGNRWFRSRYLRDRLRLAAGLPLNVNTLQEKLQLLLEDERFRRLNAQLRPGDRRGESVLDVSVDERLPYRLVLGTDDYQAPSVGGLRGFGGFELLNVTGNGDTLALGFAGSEGLRPLVDVRYAIPVTPWDTAVRLQYHREYFVVVEQPFDQLDITNTFEIFTLAVRQPVYRTLTTEVALELVGERLSSDTTLLGEDFSLSPGARNGKSVDTAIRFVQEAVYRTQNLVLSGRSRLSFGIDALGATTHSGDEPDGLFFAWLGQFQWVQRLPLLDAYTIARTDVQLSDRPLLVQEQMAVGGRYTVRGYRENTLVRDNAFVASAELRVPVIQRTRWADYLELAAFYDYGRAWNVNPPNPSPIDISSIGVGLRWGLTIPAGPFSVRPQLEVYWGHPLRNVTIAGSGTAGGTLQDAGVHFQFLVAIQ